MANDTKIALVILSILFVLSGGAKVVEKINEDTYDGQLYTVSEEFDKELQAGSKALGIDPKHVEGHLYMESGLNPRAHVNFQNGKWVYGLMDEASINSNTRGGGLFGLMKQFCKPPIWNGTFLEFMHASRIEQLRAFFRMIARYKNKIKTFSDMRMVGFAPKYLGASENTVMFRDDPDNPRDAYSANYWLDTDKNGSIEVDETTYKWKKAYNKMIANAKRHGGPKQIKV